MTTVIRRWVLRNGLELEALDESRDYYGGYWNARVVVRGEVEQVKGDLLAYFEENALPYIEHEKFPERLVRRRFEETLKEIRIRRMREELDERDL